MRVVLTTSLLSVWTGILLPSATETAEANGDTRTISLFHAHRRDSIEATYRVNGHYDPAVLEKLNYFLRDWRNDDQTRMDPRLFDVVWEVYRSAGANEPITVLSAYRSPETNAMLRRRSRAVAEHSQHMLGKAMDTTMADMSMEKLREIGMRLQRGGVGYYPSSNFVHLDVGSVRHWPRMSYDQLVRLFPDGKTVHIPSNGQPLARYEEARAEIEANGGSAPDMEQPKSKGFFAWLFGGNSGGEDDVEEVASAVPTPRGGPSRGANRNADASFVASASAPASQSLAERYGQRRPPEPAQTAAAPSNAQVASLQPAAPAAPRGKQPDADIAAQEADTSAYGSVLPTPPKRPSELMTLASVPLPPTRPAAVATFASIEPRDTTASIATDASKPAQKAPAAAAKPDAIASLISTPRQAASLGHAELPAVITQGVDKAKTSPADVLAYAAAPEPTSTLAPPLPGLRSAALGKTANAPLRSQANKGPAIVSARLDGSNFRSLTSDTATEEMPSQSVLGPSLTGLRAAARIQPGTLSNRLSANYVARFASNATDLDTSHFSGAAIQLLPSATEALQQVASFSRPRN